MNISSTYLRVFFTIISCCLLVYGNAQEVLKPLSYNINLSPVGHSQSTSAQAKALAIVPDTLPFFDDFYYAYKTPYPTTNHWVDSNVYVNTGFATGPLSMGVATFDGLNKFGAPYNINAPVSVSASADTLKSRPINLYRKGSYIYSPADSIYLSFYYQAKGNGEAPEPNDSICVDFKKPNQNKWVKVWGQKGSTDTTFYKVMIPIKDTAYFDSMFVFRFRNKATTSGSLDHWNIDYVYINKDRKIKDTLQYGDINFALPPTSFLKNYTTMPYNQYVPTEFASNFKNYIRSNNDGYVGMNYNFTVYDETGSVHGQQDQGNPLNPGVPPYKNGGYFSQAAWANPTLTISPFPTMSDSTYYTIVHSLVPVATDNQRANDTVVITQKFSNYFAYDDGKAEQGYYLNVYGAKTALRYTLNAADTLRALRIYFDPIINGGLIQNSYFRITIWADGGNGPGNVLLQDSLVKPKYLSGTYNLIPTYTLTSCLYLLPGTYYFGIQQQTNQPLNIGFDKNNDHIDALYYDIGNGWQKSTIPGGGSLMINPEMGCTVPTVVGIKDLTNNLLSFSIYPNPANESITVSTGNLILDNTILSITNSIGQLVYTEAFVNKQQINISSLPNGIYFVQLNSNGKTVSPKKLIISR